MKESQPKDGLFDLMELSWAAGLFDGEGLLGMKRRRRQSNVI